MPEKLHMFVTSQLKTIVIARDMEDARTQMESYDAGMGLMELDDEWYLEDKLCGEWCMELERGVYPRGMFSLRNRIFGGERK